MLTKSSPVNELARRNNLQLRVDTAGRGALNKYAQNPPSLAQAAKMTEEHSPTSVEEDKTNMIPIANFKSNKLSQIDKKQRQEEFEKMKANPGPASPKVHDAIRLPNKTTQGQSPTGSHSTYQSEISSPTSYLSGGRIESFFN